MDGITALIGSLTALVIALTGLMAALFKLLANRIDMVSKQGTIRDDITDRRVDRWGGFQLSRGRMEADRFYSDSEGGMDLEKSVMKAFEPIAPSLRRIKYLRQNITPVMLAEEIEGEFGEWLVKHICRPLNVKDGACLAMALTVAASDGPVAREPDSWKKSVKQAAAQSQAKALQPVVAPGATPVVATEADTER